MDLPKLLSNPEFLLKDLVSEMNSFKFETKPQELLGKPKLCRAKWKDVQWNRNLTQAQEVVNCGTAFTDGFRKNLTSILRVPEMYDLANDIINRSVDR